MPGRFPERWVLCAALTLPGAAAQAAAYAFDGGAVTGCTLSAAVYSCAPNPSTLNDDVSIGAAYTVAGNLSASTVTVAKNGVISGSVSSKTTITLAAGAYVGGSIAAGTTATLAAGAHVNGSATMGTTLTLAAGAYVNGSVAAGTTVTLAADAYVNGDLSAQTAVTLGANAYVLGNLTAGTTLTVAAGACVGGVASAATVSSSGPLKCGPVAATGPHHLLIGHSGSGVTCAPQTVSVTACANAACAAPHYGGGLSVTLTPGGQSFTIDASGINSAAAVWQTTPGGVTLAAQSLPAAQNATSCQNTALNTPGCAMDIAAAGFLFNVPNHVAETSQAFSVSAVKMADNSLACAPAFAGVAKLVNFQCAYLNPASGTLPVRVGGVALSGGAGAACSSGGTAVSLSFDARGVAPATLNYADAGKLLLSATLVPGGAGESGLLMRGSSVFIAAPAGFAVGPVAALAQAGAGPGLPNPAAADAGGAAFIPAGAAFSATFKALNSLGALTPNFGNETPPEMVGIVDTSRPAGAANYANHATLIAPAGGANPALSGGVGAFVNGAASAASLSWGEVGIIALNVKLLNAYGYLGSGGAPNALSPVGGSGNIGRFIPAYFNTTVKPGAPMPCPGALSCPAPLKGFVYSRQPFGVQVEAFNLAGGATVNYASAGGFSRPVTLTAWSGGGDTALQNPPLSPSGSALGNAGLSTFVSGVGSSIAPTYAFPAAYPATLNLAGPTAIFLRARDSDAVSSARAAASVEGGVLVVGGRWKLPNNYGSELLPMSLALSAQYWNGERYVNSDSDSASTVARADVVLGNCLKNLSAGTGLGCKGVIALALSPGVVAASSGVARFRFDAPGAGNNGSVDVSVRAPAWLPSNTVRLVFGTYKSSLIYGRELY